MRFLYRLRSPISWLVVFALLLDIKAANAITAACERSASTFGDSIFRCEAIVPQLSHFRRLAGDAASIRREARIESQLVHRFLVSASASDILRSPPRRYYNAGEMRRWTSQEQGVANVMQALLRNRPSIVERYARLDDLTADDVKTLIDDITAISEGHLALWGVNTAFDLRNAPYFGGTLYGVFGRVFSRLALEPLNFGLVWDAEKDARLSVRYALRRHDPTFIESYDRWGELSPHEREVLQERGYRLNTTRLKAWGLSSLQNPRVTPYWGGNYIRALQKTFPYLELEPLGFQLDWSTPDTALASVRFRAEKHIPELLKSYASLAAGNGGENDQLRKEVYLLRQGIFLTWGAAQAVDSAQCPWWRGSYINVLQALFPQLNLNPLGFQLHWESAEEGLASVRFVFNQRIPAIMARYRQIDTLDEQETDDLRNQIYSITWADFQIWGLAACGIKRNTPYFDGDYRQALATVFNHPRLAFSVTSLERFRKQSRTIRYFWRRGESEGVKNVRDALGRFRPDLLAVYSQQMTPDAKERLSRQVYALGQADLNAWGLSAALNVEKAPYFGGTLFGVFSKIFPDLTLNPFGFGLTWSSLENLKASIRFVFAQQAPELIESVRRFQWLSPLEKEEVLATFYGLDMPQLKAWGLSRISTENRFTKGYVDALVASFPELPLERFAFRPDWGSREKAIAYIDHTLNVAKPLLMKRYQRWEFLDASERDLVRSDIYRLRDEQGEPAALERALVSPVGKAAWHGHIFDLLQDVFPKAELDPLGFEPDHSSREASLATFRWHLRREAPELMRTYDRLGSLSGPELEDLRHWIEGITRPAFGALQMSSALKPSMVPYFAGSRAKILAAIFDDPRLTLNLKISDESSEDTLRSPSPSIGWEDLFEEWIHRTAARLLGLEAHALPNAMPAGTQVPFVAAHPASWRTFWVVGAPLGVWLGWSVSSLFLGGIVASLWNRSPIAVTVGSLAGALTFAMPAMRMILRHVRFADSPSSDFQRIGYIFQERLLRLWVDHRPDANTRLHHPSVSLRAA